MTNTNINPNYFWDYMSIEELISTLNAIDNNNKSRWEQTRFITYINALSNGSNLKSPTDIIKFSWEKEEQQIEDYSEEKQKELLSILDRF